ncbi:cytochrome P450 [Kitasatospora sp. NBC_01266]|uniref:cytochrome P450 n=1 Tax=Kitasatospora sp. NBC_01266 TaxID=2903572 RepID=UPI002E3502B0|nr:cytochrome P450 [Kitasatospora sp. NBC_01266]
MTIPAGDQLQEQAKTATFVWQMSELGDPYAKLLLRQVNPYRFCEQARELGPIHRSKVGPWVTADHQLALTILRDRRFGVRRADGTRDLAQFTSMDDSFLKLDPPDHTRLRRMVTPFFGARRFNAQRPRIEALCHELLDAVDTEAPFDLMDQLIRPLMNTLVRDLFQVPEESAERFDRNCTTTGRVFEGFASPEQYEELEAAVADLRSVLSELVELRAAEPGDDVVSELLTAYRGGGVTMDEVIGVLGLLSIAGTESTSHLMGNGVLALLEHRDQWDLLCADPELATRVVDETLRYDPPNQLISRVAHVDVELAGARIEAGDSVVILTGGANRDPKAYPDPNRFDITREGGPESLTFSTGIHFCLGAALARTAAEICFRVLVDRLPTLRQAGPVRRRMASSIRGLHRFPVSA